MWLLSGILVKYLMDIRTESFYDQILTQHSEHSKDNSFLSKERGEHYQSWCNDGGWFSYSGLINKSTFGIPIKKVCPSLWTQLFIISCKVDETTYVPCVYALLPGKSKTGYWTMFQLVREALNSRGLELAAEWMMSDFEYNIRSAFSEVFPNITLKGCSFHWAKCIKYRFEIILIMKQV